MPTVENVIYTIRAIRQKLTDKRKEFEAYETKAKTDIARLEAWLLDKSKKDGVKSFATQSGTAFRTTKDYVRLDSQDGWKTLSTYVIMTVIEPLLDVISNQNISDEEISHLINRCIESGDFSVFEKRCAKNHIKELMAEGGMKPSDLGVTYDQEVVMQVRAPNK